MPILVHLVAKSVACCIILWIFSLKASCQEPPDKFNQLTPENVPGSIVLKGFDIVGNQILPQAEIDRLLKPYLFRPIKFSSLLRLQQEITQLYVQQGYFTSGAYIPPQKIKDRTIRIEIIEGSISEIKIRGLKHLPQEYIRSRLAIASQPPLKQDKLLNALQLLQLNPLIANISAELSQGIDPGESFLEVEVEEADTFALEFSVDNYRNPSVGTFGRQGSISENNLFGFGDRFTVAYVNTDGSDSVENLSYVIPVGAYNGEIKLFHAFSDSSIISKPFQDLNLGSKNHYYEVSYRQPLYQTFKQDFSLGLAFSRQNTQLSLMDIGFPSLARGSDVEGRTNISTLRLFQEYSDRDLNHVLAIRSQFNIGLDAFDATINPDDIPDSRFFVWRGQAHYLKSLTPKTNLSLRTDLQLADRALVTSEQLTSGGIQSVRGYRQERILSDNGFFFSAELHNTLWQKSQGNLTLKLNPFFDFAQVWNSDDLPLDINTLASVGFGLELSIKENLTARLDWGIPLVTDNSFQGDSLQENGIYFSLQTKPY